MQRFQSFKFEIRPTALQLQLMRRFAGCCRFVSNLALALQRDRRDKGLKELNYEGLCFQLVRWRRQAEMPWLAEVPFGLLRQALGNLDRAFISHRAGRARCPVFKKRGRSDGFRYAGRQELHLDQRNSRLSLPELGWLRYRGGREVLGNIRNVTVSASGDRWFASILTERQVKQPIAEGPAVGIDMGVIRFATLSDGSYYAPLNSFRRHERTLAAADRGLSRKVPYSNNWTKQRARVQRAYTRVGNARRDFLHKISNTISKNHAVVCIEDLCVKDMSKSLPMNGSGNYSVARAKRGLNKSILDRGWYEFRRQLDYKLRWRGGRLVIVSPRNTSRRCPQCNFISDANRATQSRFECVNCGFQENADRVGALNVLRAGHARLACAETSPAYEASGQEPTDVSWHDC